MPILRNPYSSPTATPTVVGMGRPPRHQVPGCVYHLSTRGNDGGRIYRGARDRSSFLAHFATVVERMGWECLAYCLMTTHYHALIRLTEANLAAGMAILNGLWAKRFNRRHGHAGHLFERRYHSELVETDSHFLEAVRYVELNPVRAGLCAHPRSWRWSSFRALASDEPAPAFLATSALLAFFGDTAEKARRRYVGFIEDGIR